MPATESLKTTLARVQPYWEDRIVAEANGLPTPGQNIVAADVSGRIGWSIFGA